ncbi:MAG: cytochrome c oxidase subunit 3 [Acidobacteriales bacterium]|nr:cytochrome c oxidase subunit 3 [Candidatus Koribacter versatilis]MBI3646792.1 cytochrome c oxidase subunit 3 [Terriglobales bacterium]
MATTVHEPPKIEQKPPTGVTDRPPEPARTGIWVGLAAIAMSFAAFTSAIIVRQGSGNDWQHIVVPRILFFNTAILILSSLTLEVARKKVASFIRGQGATRAQAMGWLTATLGMGLVFVAGQYAAWLQLRSEGLYLATNPNCSFFYLLTAVHAIHVLGGLGGLARVIRRLAPAVPILRKSTMDATSYYWHFMGILWVYLLCVVWLKL